MPPYAGQIVGERQDELEPAPPRFGDDPVERAQPGLVGRAEIVLHAALLPRRVVEGPGAHHRQPERDRGVERLGGVLGMALADLVGEVVRVGEHEAPGAAVAEQLRAIARNQAQSAGAYHVVDSPAA